MKRLFYSLIMGNLFLIVCWVVITGIRLNWNFSGHHLDMYATLKQFENVSVDDWQEMVQFLGERFASIKFDFNYNYVEINDITSFFANIGEWFNGTRLLIFDFFKSVGGVISTICLYLLYCIRYLLAILRFVLFPVIV